jgi:integrase
MARTARNSKLDTRSARVKLLINKSGYWVTLSKGHAFGYRKGAKGGRWVVRIIDDNGRREAFIGVPDDIEDADGVRILSFAQAQEKARHWFLEEACKEHGSHVARGNYTVADVLEDYMTHYSVEGKTIHSTQSAINAHILPALGPTPLTKLTSKKIIEWHHGLAKRPALVRTPKEADKRNTRTLTDDPDDVRRRRASANRILTILKAALNHAWKTGRTPSDTAWRKVRPFKNVDAPVVRYLTEAEYTRLVNACPTDLQEIVKGALFTGCRYGELARLKVMDFDPDANTIAVRTSKSGKARYVVLTQEASSFFTIATAGKKSDQPIFVHENGTLWGKSHQSRPLRDACKNASIEPAVSFHILRHTHGSILAMKGVPMPVIAKQLGHSDTRMTEKHYAHLSPNYVADTIRQHFPKLGFKEDKKVAPLRKGIAV